MKLRTDPKLMEAKHIDQAQSKYLKDILLNFNGDVRQTNYNNTKANCHMYSLAVWKYIFPESDGTEFDPKPFERIKDVLPQSKQ
jgi:hypothetical protein